MVGELAVAEAVMIEAERSVETARQASLLGISKALQAMREHLQMDVGFVSEFTGETRIFRHVDSILANPPIREGMQIPLEDGYCLKVVRGELPELIPDTALVPAAMAIPETTLLPIGSHMSVPIRLSDGRLYGTFCCFSRQPDPTLNQRDLGVMRTFAQRIAEELEAGARAAAARADTERLIHAAIARQEPEIAYQPIFGLGDGMVIGAEALARFSSKSRQIPERWFEQAGMVGLRAALEVSALQNAIAGYEVCWAGRPASRLLVSISATTLVERELLPIIGAAHCRQLVLEITDQAGIDDRDRFDVALAPLRAAGVKLAVHDAGSAYASLSEAMRLHPDILVLDAGLTKYIDQDRLKRALAAALLDHANQVGCEVLARHIETPAELAVLSELGVHMGQGYSLARPGSVGDVIRHRGLESTGSRSSIH